MAEKTDKLCDVTRKPLVVFISGTGSNLLAILEAQSATDCPYEVKAVIADVEASGLEYASSRGIPTHIVALKDFENRDEWNRELARITASYQPEWVILAGFMRLLGKPMLDAFPGRILNTHPALLPSFPGAHGVRDAMAYGVKITGASLIVVDAGVDTGKILAQRAVAVLDDDTESSLHERIKVEERAMLVETLTQLCQGAG